MLGFRVQNQQRRKYVTALCDLGAPRPLPNPEACSFQDAPTEHPGIEGGGKPRSPPCGLLFPGTILGTFFSSVAPGWLILNEKGFFETYFAMQFTSRNIKLLVKNF